jgi:hypothetical protein
MTAKPKKKKVWIYSPHHSFTGHEGDKVFPTSMQSQLYKTGLYVIINNDARLQFNYTPEGMMKAEKDIRKREKAGTVTDLVFSSPIRVTTDDDGFFIQIEDETDKK